MTTLSPEARALARAIDSLTSQARRIADALTAGQQQAPTATEAHTLADGTEAGFGAVLAADEDEHRTDEDQALRWARRESLLVLLARVQHGRILTDDEAQTLRQHVETEMREAETVRAVARGNLRHVRMLYADLQQAQTAVREANKRAEAASRVGTRHMVAAEQAEAALERVRAARDRIARSQGVDAIWCLDLLDAALKPAEPASCCGKPSGALCVHDVTPKER